MKFGPKQQERLEGWLEDTLRNYNYKPTKLTVVGAGVRYEAEAEFTQKNNKNYTEFHKDFMRTLKEIAVTKGKITSTAEIAKLWQKSEYYEQASKGTIINFSNFEHKAEALLSRKPHEDVINFLRNIRGKVTINFDSYYETVLEELNDYYNSYAYEDALEELKYNATANKYIINISYNFDLDNFNINDYYYANHYQSVDEFIHKYEDDLLCSIENSFPDTVPERIKSVFNHSLKSLQNLNNPNEAITVTKVTLNFDTLSYFTFDVQLSAEVSFNQIEQLMAKVEPELSTVTLAVNYFDYPGNDYETVNLDYYYGTYSC